MSERINSYRGLHVYQNAMDSAMEIFELTKYFPIEEKYSMVDQIRRCSRSVCANLSEAWRKRRCKAAFISKLSDPETEAREVHGWIELALRCKYIDDGTSRRLDSAYDLIIGKIVRMIDETHKWLIRKK
ncbi:MAG: four helix bundle protein [Candidatus Kryptoniota bacterium]